MFARQVRFYRRNSAGEFYNLNYQKHHTTKEAIWQKMAHYMYNLQELHASPATWLMTDVFLVLVPSINESNNLLYLSVSVSPFACFFPISYFHLIITEPHLSMKILKSGDNCFFQGH